MSLSHEARTVLNFLTMSSREIAELTGKEHDNVRRDIRNMGDELYLSFEEKVVPSDGGRPSKVFMLSKRETLILISGYSTQLRARIIDRWQDLEAQQGPRLPTTMAEALRLGQSAQRGLRRTLQPLVQMWSALARIQHRRIAQGHRRSRGTHRQSFGNCLESRLTVRPNGEALSLQGKSSRQARRR